MTIGNTSGMEIDEGFVNSWEREWEGVIIVKGWVSPISS